MKEEFEKERVQKEQEMTNKIKIEIIKELSDPNYDSQKMFREIQEKNMKTKRNKFELPVED